MDLVLSVLGLALVDDVGDQVVGGSFRVLGLHVRPQQVAKLDASNRKVDDGRVLLDEKCVLREPGR